MIAAIATATLVSGLASTTDMTSCIKYGIREFSAHAPDAHRVPEQP